MKFKLPLLLLTLLIIASILSGCAGAASAASSWPGLAASQDTAYLAYNQEVYAIDATNGTKKWQFPTEANSKISFYAAPILTPDGQLLVGGYDNTLYSLNPETGQENWTFKGAKSRYVGSPLATDSGIYAPAADDTLYALDLKGNLSWQFTTQGPLWAQPATDSQCNCIYLPSMDHHLYAIDAQSGSKNWETGDLGGAIVGTPAISPDGSTLYVGTFASQVIAIDAQNGKVKWQFSTNGWVWGGPVLQGGVLYFGDLKGTFYAVDVSTQQKNWEIQPDGPISESPLVTQDAVYFTTETGTLYAVDIQNGNVRWPKTIGGKLYTSPAASGDLILVAPISADGLIYALDSSGTQKWVYALPKK